MNELKPIKSRKERNCEWCGKSIKKGDTYYGYSIRYAEHICGPGSRKGHFKWVFESGCICPDCYAVEPNITCCKCGERLKYTDAVYLASESGAWAGGKLFRFGGYLRSENPPKVRHQLCPNEVA